MVGSPSLWLFSELRRLSWFCGKDNGQFSESPHQRSQYQQGTGGSSRSSSSSCSSDSERRSVPPNLLAMISGVPGSVAGVGEKSGETPPRFTAGSTVNTRPGTSATS